MGNYNFKLDLQEHNTMSYIDSYIAGESRVLEFGAANGRLTRYLSREKGCRVTIVEVDAQSGGEAAEFAESAFLGPETGDINHLVWYDADNKFDYIIFADVLEHLPEPEKILALCKDMLLPEGRILVSIPNIAHNSILIGLYGDEFEYDEVGLLDKTHIHFFTYHTFYRMIERLGMSIVDQQAVYSSVGWNEIKNSYADVPHTVELALRRRKSGSIYQYVFCLAYGENTKQQKKTFADLVGFARDYDKWEEASCFLYDKDLDAEPQVRIGQVYPVHKDNCVAFECDSQARKVRFDVMEAKVFLRVNHITIETGEGRVTYHGTLRHNAEVEIGELLCFDNDDPWVEIILPEQVVGIQRVILDFTVLAYRFEDDFCRLLIEIINQIRDDDEQQRAFKQLEEAKEYNTHLENDLKVQREYIAHLEQDIRDLKEHIEERNKRFLWR